MFLRQASFAGGEIAPTLQGRSDVGKYHTATSLSRNMIPLRHGPLTSRPGTRYVGLASGVANRLIPFILSNTTSYLLLFYEYSTAVKLDIYKNGTRVVTLMATPYAPADLARLKYAQQGKVLTICHPDHAPYELTYTNDTTWALAAVSFDARAAKFWDMTSAGVPKVEMSTIVVRDWDASTVYSYDSNPPGIGADCVVKYASKNYVCVWRLNLNQRPDLSNVGGTAGVDWFWTPIAFAGKNWQWAITTLFRDSHNRVLESAPYYVTKCRMFGWALWNETVTYDTGDKVSVDEVTGWYYQSLVDTNIGNNPLLTPAKWSGPFGVLESGRRHVNASDRAIPAEIILTKDLPATISWKSQSQSPSAADPQLIGWRVYRGEGGQIFNAYGWVGDATTEQFVDLGNAPDYTRQPPQGRNPFKVYDGTGALAATENPTAVAYFEQRRVFAAPYASATGGRMGWLLGSKVGDYANFDSALMAQTADQEYEFELVAQTFQDIRSLMPLSKLLVFTGSAEWAVGGSGGALAFDNVDAKIQGAHGSAWLDPLQVGNEALYVQERGPHIQSLVFDFQTQSWDGDELNLFADHLLDGHTIVSWCWAHQPYHALFMVRDDGVLLTMTYHREQQVNAWARHDTATGVIEDVCAVPESGGDAVYWIVRRTSGGATRIFLERVTTLTEPPDWRTGCFLDCVHTASSGTSPTFTRLADQDVVVIQSGVATNMHVNGSGVVVGLTTPLAADIVVGLAYTQEMAPLAPVLERQEVKTAFASLTRLSLEAIAIGSVQVGQDSDHLQTVASGVAGTTPQQCLIESRVANKFVKWPSALGFVRQTGPYPLTLLSLIREVEFEGS